MNTKNEKVLGGWSSYEPLTVEDKKVFSEALMGFVGVDYEPLKVSRQVVAGMNYRYKCNATIPPSEVIWEAVVEIFKPLDGKPYIIGILRI